MKKNLLFSIIGLFISFSIIQAQDWNQIIKANSDDVWSADYFGHSVCVAGNYIVVGAYQENPDLGSGEIIDAGSAYVFKNDGSDNYTQIAKLTAGDAQAIDWFGHSVSISGNYIIVGAHQEDPDFGSGEIMGAGSAYIFKNDGSDNFTQIAKLNALDAASDDWFGYSVSISGEYAIVGAYGDGPIQGSAYVFKNDGSDNFSQAAKLTEDDAQAGGFFGFSVCINGDYAVIGRPEGSSTSGSAYIFKNDGTGNFSQTAKLNSDDAGNYDNFGWSVCINGDYVIIGAKREDPDFGAGEIPDAGSAYVFRNDGSDNYSQIDKLNAFDAQTVDYFGISVSISANGDHAIVGAYFEDPDFGSGEISGAGSAYVFRNNGYDSYSQTSKLTADDAQSNDRFGYGVAISDETAVITAPFEDPDIGSGITPNGGSAYIYKIIINVTNQPENQVNVCIGSNISYSVNGDYIDSYQWQLSTDNGNSFIDIIDGGQYSNALTATLNITDVTVDMESYLFQCVVSNTEGADISDIAKLIVDYENPVLSVQNFTAELNASGNVEITAFDLVTGATDNCLNADTILSQSIFDCSDLGSNNIDVTLTDFAGNFVTETVEITVEDNIIPAITCIDNQTVTANQYNVYVVNNNEFDPVESNDNCNILSVINDFNNSNTLANEQLSEGMHIIEWTITDNSGNINTCTYTVTVNAYTGMNNLSKYISLYPNPVSDILIINMNDFLNNSNVKVEISDITGKIIYKSSIEKGRTEIDLSLLVSGIYLLKIKSDNEVFTTKIVKE